MTKQIGFVVLISFCANALGTQFIIDSKKTARSLLEAKEATMNMSYPDGPTSTPSPEQCPTSVPCACEEQGNGTLLAAVLTPVLSVVSFGLGVLVGACAIKRKKRD